MAVIQISKIQVRRGLQDNLPQLSGGEFGWSVDSRRLYIGNGTLTEGAPAVGLTEILTEHSAASQATDITVLQGNIAVLEADVSNLAIRITGVESALTSIAVTLTDATSSFANVIDFGISDTIFVDYAITRYNGSNTDARTGTIKASVINGVAMYADDYVETANVGVIFDIVDTGSVAVWKYVTSSTGYNANLTLYPSKTFS